MLDRNVVSGDAFYRMALTLSRSPAEDQKKIRRRVIRIRFAVSMSLRLSLLLLVLIGGFFPMSVLGQSQTCPVNINFSSEDLSDWSALTGLLGGASRDYQPPNTGVTIIPEYNISGTGIQVVTTAGIDPFGGFSTIPVINGYNYQYAVKLGSTATSFDLQLPRTNNPGGFRRAITYTINVPAGPSTEPYTMTYAYAMVLENGTHNSDQQPMFKATLSTQSGVVDCASPKYYLPTLNNAGGGPGGGPGGGLLGATLDSAAALSEGFTLSPRPFLSHAGTNPNGGTLLHDVWTKGWTEVTFDLSSYRGQTVTLTFEADNCVPGAHFAYAYVALRNSCGGLMISGPAKACVNTKATYSVPSLANATYQWTIPAGWTLNSGAGTNKIEVTPNTSAGYITVHEVNSCADLKDTLAVSASPPTIAGRLTGAATVCTGVNSVPISLQGQRGHVVGWYASTDGTHWDSLDNQAASYTAENLDSTTQYIVLVQNGDACSIDTSDGVTVTVDPRSRGGTLDPGRIVVCAGQNQGSLLSLKDQTGSVLNWQQSLDSATWSDFAPPGKQPSFNVGAITQTTYYRVIVKSGVCPQDTSTVTATVFEPSPFPEAAITPLNASICYGDSISLHADVGRGTNYTWAPDSSLSGMLEGQIRSVPAALDVMAKPFDTTDYIFTLQSEGCPNSRKDTFHIAVSPPIIVSAGSDTAIIAGQQLQLNAFVNDPGADMFTWQPPTGLNFTNIPDPIASLGLETDTVTYIVKAADAAGCYGKDSLMVAVFKTGADIFVPTAFTPNGDGMNDLLRPICVGIRQLSYFRVYDRWGKLVFATHQMGAGWDGRIHGTAQPTGGYVYMAAGTDYTGKTIFKKGSVILIR